MAAMTEPIVTYDWQVRVRYCECDPGGVAHHSVYPIWLEAARGEMLRETGFTYREMEATGLYFVVARMNFRFRKPAMYDDHLRVNVGLLPSSRVKLDHVYKVFRDDVLLTEATTTLVCVDKNGKPNPVPVTVMPG